MKFYVCWFMVMLIFMMSDLLCPDIVNDAATVVCEQIVSVVNEPAVVEAVQKEATGYWPWILQQVQGRKDDFKSLGDYKNTIELLVIIGGVGYALYRWLRFGADPQVESSLERMGVDKTLQQCLNKSLDTYKNKTLLEVNQIEYPQECEEQLRNYALIWGDEYRQKKLVAWKGLGDGMIRSRINNQNEEIPS